MNAYGMARAFYRSLWCEATCTKPYEHGKIQQSDLWTFREIPRLHIEERFVTALKP